MTLNDIQSFVDVLIYYVIGDWFRGSVTCTCLGVGGGFLTVVCNCEAPWVAFYALKVLYK